MHIQKKIECDILVVGGGNAGLIATLEAKNAGAPLAFDRERAAV